MAHVTIVGEGPPDVEVAKRLCAVVGHLAGPVHITNGKGKLDAQLSGYNNAARFSPWFVMRDLNGDAACASALVQTLLPQAAQNLRLRIAVRSVEAWLLADRENVSSFLAVSLKHLPVDAESLHDPKGALVNLAARSRRRDVRRDMVPAAGTSARVGRGYTARLIEFVGTAWDPVAAAQESDSLRRCITALRTL